MNDRPLWITVIQWAVWAVVVFAVMGWLGRSRLRARPAADSHTLVYPTSLLIIGLLSFSFFAAIAVISNVFRNQTTTWWTTTVFVGFAVLSGYLLLEYFLVKHRVSDTGLEFKSILSRYELRWSDLRDVRYAPSMKWFRLETRSGDVARVSVMLMGLPEFARTLLQHAPEAAFRADAREILETTAEGSPPSVWQ